MSNAMPIVASPRNAVRQIGVSSTGTRQHVAHSCPILTWVPPPAPLCRPSVPTIEPPSMSLPPASPAQLQSDFLGGDAASVDGSTTSLSSSSSTRPDRARSLSTYNFINYSCSAPSISYMQKFVTGVDQQRAANTGSSVAISGIGAGFGDAAQGFKGAVGRRNKNKSKPSSRATVDSEHSGHNNNNNDSSSNHSNSSSYSGQSQSSTSGLGFHNNAGGGGSGNLSSSAGVVPPGSSPTIFSLMQGEFSVGTGPIVLSGGGGDNSSNRNHRHGSRASSTETNDSHPSSVGGGNTRRASGSGTNAGAGKTSSINNGGGDADLLPDELNFSLSLNERQRDSQSELPFQME